jgi:orotate phosphoribosyltransferase
VEKVDDIEIHAIFHPEDVQGFASYPAAHCPLCKSGEPIHAIVNSFGYSALNRG